VWRVETLLVKMAISPSSFRVWDAALTWLGEAFARVDKTQLKRELSIASVQSWVRLTYMADCAQQHDLAEELFHAVKTRHDSRPRVLRQTSGRQRFIAKYNLVDAIALSEIRV